MPDPVDLTFVAGDVTGGTWLEWGTGFENITNLVDQAIEHLSSHGSEADLLRAIARFAIERDH